VPVTVGGINLVVLGYIRCFKLQEPCFIAGLIYFSPFSQCEGRPRHCVRRSPPLSPPRRADEWYSPDPGSFSRHCALFFAPGGCTRRLKGKSRSWESNINRNTKSQGPSPFAKSLPAPQTRISCRCHHGGQIRSKGRPRRCSDLSSTFQILF